MIIKAMMTKEDSIQALERFEEIIQAEPGTKESDEADALAAMIKEYEDENFSIT